MKLLRLKNDDKHTEGQFLDLSERKEGVSDESCYKSVELIEKEDVLDMLTYMLDHDDCSFDPFDEKALQNPAQQLIYKELHSELTKVYASRKEIVQRINDQFKEIESKYE